MANEKTTQKIINSIKSGGVVGAGGAGFPTHIKTSAKVEYVVANGAECEPLLDTDKTLITLYPNEIINGLKLVMKATSAKKGIIALKEKYTEQIKVIKEAIKEIPNIEIKLLKNFYPAGDEHSLVYAVTGKVIPEGGIPLDIRVVVNNVGTLYNINNAYHGIPVTERMLTITGIVNKPITLKVAIGTKFSDLIKFAGIDENQDFAVIDGGPMMGKLVNPEETYVTKTTTSIIVLPPDNPVIAKREEPIKRSIKLAKTVCIQCNTCTENCTRHNLGHNLKPHLLMRKIGFTAGKIDESFADAYLCCECGLCTFYACPMNLSPHKVIQFIKSELSKNGIKNKNLNKHPVAINFYDEHLVPTNRLEGRLELEEYHKKSLFYNKLFEPNKVRIYLKQHIGISAKPIKKIGDKVKKGDLIAEIQDDKVGANIHSSINGTITEITDKFIEIVNK